MLVIYPVKARVKTVENFWMTAIRKFGFPEIFPYFLSNINKLISYL